MPGARITKSVHRSTGVGGGASARVTPSGGAPIPSSTAHISSKALTANTSMNAQPGALGHALDVRNQSRDGRPRRGQVRLKQRLEIAVAQAVAAALPASELGRAGVAFGQRGADDPAALVRIAGRVDDGHLDHWATPYANASYRYSQAVRRGGGAAERTGLENRQWPSRSFVGSNPTPAAVTALNPHGLVAWPRPFGPVWVLDSWRMSDLMEDRDGTEAVHA